MRIIVNQSLKSGFELYPRWVPLVYVFAEKEVFWISALQMSGKNRNRFELDKFSIQNLLSISAC